MSDDKSIPISPAALEAFAAGLPSQPQSAPGADTSAASSHVGEGSEGILGTAAESIDAGTDKDQSINGEQNAGEPTSEEAIEAEASEDSRFPITVLPGFCTRLAGSTCERCTFVCPFDAITFDDQNRPHIDEQYCTRCGLCCGICDAFVTERITMNDLLERVRRLSAEGEPVFFTCYDQIPEDFEVHPNVIVLPCIGAVAPEFWTAALKLNPRLEIYCNFVLCVDCPTAGPEAKALFTHAVNLGEQWSHTHMGKADRLYEKTDLLSRFFEATSDEFQRRGVATSLASEVEDIVTGKHRKRYSETLAKHHERNAQLRAQGHSHNLHHHKHVPSTPDLPIRKRWPRLTLIANAVEEHPEIAPNIPRYFAAVDRTTCEHCYEPCFSHCPAGARYLNNAREIEIDPKLCIACGNCALYCPTNAAYLYETDASIFLTDKPDDAADAETNENE